MAVTRFSALHTIYEIPSGFLLNLGNYALARLDNGGMAAVAQSINAADGSTSLFVTVVNSANTSHTARVNFAFDTNTSTATISNFNPFVTAGGGNNFAINWDRVFEINAIYDVNALTSIFNGSGTPLSGTLNGSTSPGGIEQSSSMVRLGNGNYLMSWTDSLTTGLANLNTEIMGRVFNPMGSALSGEFRINTTTAGAQTDNGSVALATGRSFVHWSEGTVTHTTEFPRIAYTGLKGRFLDAAGVATGGEIVIDSVSRPGAGIGDVSAVALGHGGFVVGWVERWDEGGPRPLGYSDTYRFQVFNAAGAKIGTETVVYTFSASFADEFGLVELANGGFAVSWQDGVTHVRTYSSIGTPASADIELSAIANEGTDGLDDIFKLALMADGKVMALGFDEFDTFPEPSRIGTQVFDFGDDRLIGGAAANTLFGKNGVNDKIYGFGGNDTLYGLSGNDLIDGGTGNDRMTGGPGNDTYYVDSAADAVVETSPAGGTDRVVSSVTYTLSANVEQLVLAGMPIIHGIGNGSNNYIVGNSAKNALNGAAGNDILNGGAGDDVVFGGLGNDVLTGGAGFDSFLFNTAPNSFNNRDIITDFNVADDTIRLENAVFGALGSATGTLAAFRFHASATGAAADAFDRIIYNTTTGVLSYDVNGNAAGGAAQFAVLSTKPVGLTNADFLVI